jgi:hypothetical protein
MSQNLNLSASAGNILELPVSDAYSALAAQSLENTSAIGDFCEAELVSGFGQYHTNEIDPDKPNRKLTPYVTTTWPEVVSMSQTPPSVSKEKGQWFIPSTLASRSFKAQEAEGEYWVLCFDFDLNTLPLNEVVNAVDEAIRSQVNLVAYTSRSATPERCKCRVLVPLALPLKYQDYQAVLRILNDRLDASRENREIKIVNQDTGEIKVVIGHDLTPDRALERAAQLVYLPNKGDFYDSRATNGDLFDPLKTMAKELAEYFASIEIKRQAAQIEREARQAQALEKRQAITTSKYARPIDAFNNTYTVEEMLVKAGYDFDGTHNYRHPRSESGSYSASVENGRVYSLSPNDDLYTADESNGAHDAFSAFCVLLHGGDQIAAIKDAGDNWLSINGESWNKVAQLEYMQNKKSQSADAISPADDGQLPHIADVEVWTDKTVTEYPSKLSEFPTVLMNKVLSWIAQSAEETNNALNVSSTIHLAAAAMSRCVTSNLRNYSAVYFGQIGASGIGKNVGKSAAADCLTLAISQQIFNDFHTDSSVFSLLRVNPCAVLHLDEFGDKIANVTKSKNGAPSGMKIIKEIYSNAGKFCHPPAYGLAGLNAVQRAAFQANNARIVKPHLNILAVTTPGQYHDALTDGMVEGGFINRFVWVEAAGEMVVNKDGFDDTPPQWLIDYIIDTRWACTGAAPDGDLKGIMTVNVDPDSEPTLRKFKFCKDSEQLLDKFKDEIRLRGKNDEFMADMSQRWRENAMRIALVIHSFSNTDEATIDPTITEWCIDYCRYHGLVAARKMLELARPKQIYGQRKKDYLLAFRARPDGVAQSDLHRYSPWQNDEPRYRKTILEDLVNGGEIALVYGDRKGQGGRGAKPKLYVALSQ